MMSGGGVFSNSAHSGGGVYARGRFTMTGGVISRNIASNRGGGVYGTGHGVVFAKTGGTIYGFAGSGNDNRANNGHAVARSLGGSNPINRLRNSTAGPGVNMDFRTAGAAGGWEN